MHTTSSRPRRRLAASVPAVLLAALLGLTACSSGGGGGAKGGPSGAQGAFAPAPPTAACQEHQRNQPGTEYTSEEDGDTGKVFELLRHYTANGLKPFCDGKPPTDLDRQWAKLFLGFGADPGLLAAPLGGSGQPPAEPMEDAPAPANNVAGPTGEPAATDDDAPPPAPDPT
ncbi:hypothetical protein [Yinghuangia seranimata]|uniref:hypothetical protein n=1 Tax=Yinghuangia seranimata TaxID=408067 RepID=UPI00248B21E1|nr:hypothetical protein [Yinghuangia seranimata]MDI2127911.1 hypothetical protein [Yinghuangia seranimata]